MQPNCQADFTMMRREVKKKKRLNKPRPGTISHLQAAQTSTERSSQGITEAEMKRKARSNLFVVARTQFFRAH